MTLIKDPEPLRASARTLSARAFGILADDGTVLLDSLIRPIRCSSWPEAQRIPGIAPEDVAGAPALASLSPRMAAALVTRAALKGQPACVIDALAPAALNVPPNGSGISLPYDTPRAECIVQDRLTR